MKIVSLENIHNKKASFYFALEEALCQIHSDTDYFFIWNVPKTVMIGRHQVTELEVNIDFANENGIDLVRRNSGGGAVFTDINCLQYSLITSKKRADLAFNQSSKPVIDFLNENNIPAMFTGRNDILVNGRKVSGNALAYMKDKMIVHGTLLVNTDLNTMVNVLTPDHSKLAKNAVKSVSSRVLNVGQSLNLSAEEIKKAILKYLSLGTIKIDDALMEHILQLESKFVDDNWTYVKRDKGLQFKRQTQAGLMDVRLYLDHNIIKDMVISGDFFELKDVHYLASKFIGVKFDYSSMVKIAQHQKVHEYIFKINTKEFLGIFFEGRQQYLKKPSFLKLDKRNLTQQVSHLKSMLREHRLHTVCEEASCPNLMECFNSKTATFMILGSKCTRNCAYCDVDTGKGMPVDTDEPMNIVKSVKLMGLKHVVITSVTRDDLKDQGANQFVAVINAIKYHCPGVTIEVLTPDFNGDNELIARVVAAGPDVYNHNVETVPRLYKGFRDRATYKRSLELLKTIKKIDPTMTTKSGIMVGVGEYEHEVIELMNDLVSVGVDLMTIGQYLQPSFDHYPVIEYVTPEQFERYELLGEAAGLKQVFSGPFVRSSYHAEEQFGRKK